MKNSDTTGRDEALSKLLRTWKPDAQLPPRFQEAVWQRIENVAPSAALSLWRLLAARIEAAFSRPALATAYIALLLLVGLGAGYWRAEDKAIQADSALRSRYVQTVDPYQMPRN